MVVTLFTNLEGLIKYKTDNDCIAASKFGGSEIGFVHEIQVNVSEIKREAYEYRSNYVVIKRPKRSFKC